MPQLDLDGANSKISADKIEGQSGTTVTVTEGHNLAGSGSGLTALPAGNLTGTVANANLASGIDASKLTTGTLPMARLSGTLPALNGSALTNLPDQSATDVKFSVCLSTSHNNVTGDGTGWWTNTSGVSWSTPIINTGSGFSGGLFTVPAGGAGTYLFSFHSWIGGITSSHTEAYGYFETSNRNYEAYHGSPYASYVIANTSQSFNWQTIADMDVGDTCKVKMGIYNGTKVCDMRGNGGFNYTSTVFQGVLLA